MSLNIEAAGSWPIELRLARSGAIYECADLEATPIEPGVYVFGREHGYAVAPLYIGQALNGTLEVERHPQIRSKARIS
jgi:hypothetical protein